MKLNGMLSGKMVEVSTRYPEVVSACVRQNIPLGKVFAKIEDTNGDEILDASYPLVKINSDGMIPTNSDGDIIFDSGRVVSATAYSQKNNESEDVKDTIEDAREDIAEDSGEEGTEGVI